MTSVRHVLSLESEANIQMILPLEKTFPHILSIFFSEVFLYSVLSIKSSELFAE
jgi:hypothetical protein